MSPAAPNSTLRSVVLGTVAGTALSIVLSIILLLTTSEKAQIALMIALAGTILSALLGASVSFAQRLDNLGETVLDGSKLRALAGMPRAESEIVELATHLESVSSKMGGQGGFFWEASIQAVEDAKNAVRSVATGTVVCTSEQEIFYVEKALESTNKTVCAVAARGPEWWARPEADAYWAVYGRAAQRLQINRVFLVSLPMSNDVERVLDRHAALGIETHWIAMDKVPVSFRRPIVLFDHALLHRTTSNPRLGSDHVDFTNSVREINEAHAQFKTILSLAATKRWPAPVAEH
jgi:hypothetical protein